MYVVIVTFDIHPGAPAAFASAMEKNAALSRQEPQCYQFDVCFTPDRKRCFLYEVYEDRAAFDAHVATAHFKECDAATRPLVATKQVETFTLVSGGPPRKR